MQPSTQTHIHDVQQKCLQGYLTTSQAPMNPPPLSGLTVHSTSLLIYAASSQLSPQELREIVTAFNDTNDPKAVQASGLHLAGEKYFVIKADEKSLYGKKVRSPLSLTPTLSLPPNPMISHSLPSLSMSSNANQIPTLTLLVFFFNILFNQGKEGAVIVKTKQALLITHYPETVQPGQAATTVEKLGDYLITQSY
jgi:profilin